MAEELTPEDKEELEVQVNDLMADRSSPYWNKDHPNHQKAIETVAGIYEILHPNIKNPVDG